MPAPNETAAAAVSKFGRVAANHLNWRGAQRAESAAERVQDANFDLLTFAV